MKTPRWFANPWLRALFALALVVAIGCLFHADGAFFRWSTHRDMLRQVSVPGILALHRGEIAAQFARADATADKVLAAAMGAGPATP